MRLFEPIDRKLRHLFRPASAAVVGGLLGTSLVLGAAEPTIEGTIEAVITSDRMLAVSLPRDAEDSLTYAIVVGEEVTAVDLRLSEATGDLDLFARWSRPMASYDEADHVADSSRGNETLRLSRHESPRLRTGTYYLDVVRREALARTAKLAVTFERGAEPSPSVFEAPGPEASTDDRVRAKVAGDALFTVPFRNGEDTYYTIEIEVPSRTRAILIEARGAGADIDLHARRGAHLENWEEDPEYSAATANWDEQLVLAGDGRFLKAGTYYLDIVNYEEWGGAGPVEILVDYNPERIEPLPASGGEVAILVPGTTLGAELDRERFRGKPFRFEVPPETRRIDVVAFNATRDLDLFIRAGQPVTSYEAGENGYDFAQVSVRLDEILTIEANAGDFLAPGWWYLDVACLGTYDLGAHFEIRLELNGAAAPRAIEWDRWMPDPDDTRWSPLERVLLATMEVRSENGGGSGTCVSPDGYVLTNYHVLDGDLGFQTEGIYLSLTHDFHAEPRQLFRAEVVEADADLDFALLRIVGDVFGHPLPDGLRLPHLPLLPAPPLHLGDALYVAGFPEVGGDENRFSLSLTRGILAGFVEDRSDRRGWIKTDARINAGHSGGTLLSADTLQFVGVPSREIVVEDDELGFCRPVALFPAAWRVYLESPQDREALEKRPKKEGSQTASPG